MNDSHSLWTRYVNDRLPADRERLIERYAHLARVVVERLNVTVWGSMSYDDLVSHALVGLIDAVDRYKPGTGAEFETFAMTRIRGSVLDALRHLDWAPRSVRQQEAELKRAYAALEGRLGRAATDAEMARYLGISEDELDQMVANVSRASVYALDETLDTGEGQVSRLDLIEDEASPDPMRASQRTETERMLTEAISALPERERMVVSLYYYNEMTFKEIGFILGVTEQRISQIHSKAVMRLENKLHRYSEVLIAA
jgi:RNA polymerase sigma factor FliA